MWLEIIVGLIAFWVLILSVFMVYVINFKQETFDMYFYVKRTDLDRKLALYMDRCERLVKNSSYDHLRKDHGYYYDEREVKVRIDRPEQPAVSE